VQVQHSVLLNQASWPNLVSHVPWN